METVCGEVRMSLLKEFFLVILEHLFAGEVKSWLSYLPTKLIHWSALRFPKNQQARYEEEWLAHCADLPGILAKLAHSFGCLSSAIQVNHDLLEFAVITIVRFSFAACAPAIFAMKTLNRLVGVARWSLLDPECARLRRLEKQSGGIITLGLEDLELKHQDFTLCHLDEFFESIEEGDEEDFREVVGTRLKYFFVKETVCQFRKHGLF
jgi:hypothetical protein